MTPKEERDQRMALAYRTGKTLHEIGQAQMPPISRERVRQILKRLGMNREDSTRSQVAKARREAIVQKRAERLATMRPAYGCTEQEARALNDGLLLADKTGKAWFFWQNQRNARSLGIEWQLTFPQWWQLWAESGVWHLRGRGNGYGLTRHKGQGPFAIGNVAIITQQQHMRELQAMRVELGWAAQGSKKKDFCKRGHALTDDNRDIHGSCKLCRPIRERERRARLKGGV